MRFFGSKSGNQQANAPERSARHSSGWAHMLKHLRDNENLRVLDIGSTSSGNINFLTNIGHSIYMASIIQESQDSKWTIPATASEGARFDVDRFLAESLDFGDRQFDVILLWDTLDFLPEVLIAPVIKRLHQVLRSGGVILAFFHIKQEGTLTRYHLREDEQVDMQIAANKPVLRIYNNRQVENIFAAFTTFRFFLAKDNLREVFVTR